MFYAVLHQHTICFVRYFMFVLPNFQKLKVKILQHETHIISETTNDISYPILYSSHPIGPSGVGHRQGDNTGKGILPTPPSMGGGCGCTFPTYYICNKSWYIKANCWYSPANNDKQGQSSRGRDLGVQPQGPRPVYFLRQPQSAYQSHADHMGQPPIVGQPASPSSVDIQNLLMTALSQMNIKQNETGQSYVDSVCSTCHE